MTTKTPHLEQTSDRQVSNIDHANIDSLDDLGLKLDLDSVMSRDATEADLIYLLDRCPFLILANHDLCEELNPHTIVKGAAGWPVHDCGDTLATSPGPFMFWGGDFRWRSPLDLQNNDDDGEDRRGRGSINPGLGTIFHQMLLSAMGLIAMSQDEKHRWSKVVFIDGHPRMAGLAWLAAKHLGVTFKGYEPTERDYRRLNDYQMTGSEFEALKLKRDQRRRLEQRRAIRPKNSGPATLR